MTFIPTSGYSENRTSTVFEDEGVKQRAEFQYVLDASWTPVEFSEKQTSLIVENGSIRQRATVVYSLNGGEGGGGGSTVDPTKVKKSGDTMTGDLNMNNSSITFETTGEGVTGKAEIRAGTDNSFNVYTADSDLASYTFTETQFLPGLDNDIRSIGAPGRKWNTLYISTLNASVDGNTDYNIVLPDNKGGTIALLTDIKHGLIGDYKALYGIVNYTDGLATFNVGSNNIQISAGTQLKLPDKTTLTQIASTDTHQTVSTTNFTMFYADGHYLECDIYWQVEEPEDNGGVRYQAWWDGGETKQWKLRSNDTGNVWRYTPDCGPMFNVHFTNGSLTRIDFSPYTNLEADVIATREFVLSQGGGASLPDQEGNAGKFLTTDGENASWAALGDIGAGIIDFDMDENGNWYRIYESGWCEQGGIIEKTSASTSNSAITLPRKYCLSKYNIQITPKSTDANTVSVQVIGDATKKTFEVGSSDSWKGCYWQTSGYPYGYEFTITPNPADATVTLNAPKSSQEGNGIIAPVGSTVTYTVTKEGYNTITSTYKMGNFDASQVITLGEGSLYVGAQLQDTNGNNVAFIAFLDESHNNWIALPYAQYRSFNKWDTSTGASGMDYTTYTTGTVTAATTDEELNALANDIQTGTYRTDFLLNLDPTGEKYLAAYAARNCLGEGVGVVVDGTTYYPQLPNINTVMRAFRVKSTLDQYDPTATAYSTYNMNSWSFGGKSYCWSSSEYSSYFSLFLGSYGRLRSSSKTDEYGVLPVLEIPNTL